MDQSGREKWVQALGKPSGESDKNWAVAVLLSALFGYLGADRFYLGYVESAVLKLVTVGGLGLWWLWDLLFLITASLPDADGYWLKREIRLTPGLVLLLLVFAAGVVIAFMSLLVSGRR
jgi:TM2 domain-containing membrane protein YozV